MKSTEVDESLSTTTTTVLIQRKPTYFKTSILTQKMRECAKWAERKAEAFQVKEAQRHYDKRGRAVAL